MMRAILALLCLCAVLPASAGSPPQGVEIPVLTAIQTGADGKPMPIMPTASGLIELLAKESKLNLVLHAYPWRRAQAMAERGEGLLFGAAATHEREPFFHFTRPLYQVNQFLVASAQRPFPFQRWEDLRGKTISIPAGAHYVGEFEANRDTLFKVSENAETIAARMKMLDLGRVDAVLRESTRNAHDTEARINCSFAELGKFVVLDKTVAIEPVMLAVPKKGAYAEVIGPLNEAIERVTRVQGFQKVIEKMRVGTNCP